MLIWFSIENTDDQVRKGLLKAQSQRLLANLQRTGSIYNKDELIGIKILLEGRDSIPPNWLSMPAGVREQDKGNIHVAKLLVKMDNSERQVFLVHKPLNGDVLDNNELSVQLLLIIVSLIVTLIGSLVGLFLARNIASPLQELSLRIKNTDPNNPEFNPLQRNDEFGEISSAFAKTLLQIKQVLEREKQFSAYASHELRTPVAVIKSSLELSEACRKAPNSVKSQEIEKQALSRMAIANHQMELLIKTFLYLGKESSTPHNISEINIADILRQKIDQYRKEYQSKKINISQHIPQSLIISCDGNILELIVDNILRNAFSYCAGSVSLILNNNEFIIYNDIDKLRIDKAEHFGFGLRIVEDLCQTQHWKLTSNSDVNNQYSSTISFE